MSECAYTMKCRECGETHCAMVKCSERTASGPSDATDCSASSIVEKRGDVWMMSGKPCQSCAREIAEIAMRSMGLDATDFRLRDTVITAISDKVGAMLDAARNSQNSGGQVSPDAQREGIS